MKKKSSVPNIALAIMMIKEKKELIARSRRNRMKKKSSVLNIALALYDEKREERVTE
jgi:hypothetical protein